MCNISARKNKTKGLFKATFFAGLGCLFCAIVSVQNTDERPGKYNEHSSLEHMQRSAWCTPGSGELQALG